MISNFGNLLLFISIVLSLSIIYLSNKNLKLNGNQIKASKILGLNRNTLRKKINELDIEIIKKVKQ